MNYERMKEIAVAIIHEISDIEDKHERSYKQRKLLDSHPQAHRVVIKQYINNLKKSVRAKNNFNSKIPLY